jgi:hypothetical protein
LERENKNEMAELKNPFPSPRQKRKKEEKSNNFSLLLFSFSKRSRKWGQLLLFYTCRATLLSRITRQAKAKPLLSPILLAFPCSLSSLSSSGDTTLYRSQFPCADRRGTTPDAVICSNKPQQVSFTRGDRGAQSYPA